MKTFPLSRSQIKVLSLALVGLVSSLFVLLLFALNAPLVKAAPLSFSGDDFDPGRLIDDDVMVNYSTMTADEIQAFLEDNVEGGECDREPDPGSPTCLFEYQENPETGENNYGLFDDGFPAEIEGASTAAEIIWQEAQDHQINPQTLLVLIQKEQGLITDNDPWLRQFEKATGYHCPDGAPCSETAAGFYRQVSQAAWQLRRYLDHSEDYWYAIGENLIFYHPRTSCGQGVVDIQNKATIALYLYTPYTPNEAALNNLFGRGDSCSSYGNRNFWSYFHRWFGSPTSGLPLPPAEEEEESSPSWAYEVSYQGVFEDETQSAALFSNSNRMSPGQTLYVVLDFKNTGSSTWNRDEGAAQVSLFAQGQSLWLCHDSWLNGCEQPALLEQERVEPGQTGSFEFWVMAPEANGQFVASFSPFNLDNHLSGTAADFIFEVAGASEDADLSQSPPLVPEVSESEEEDPEESPTEVEEVEEEEEAESTEVAVGPDGVVILPDDWDELSPIEKLLLNPWGCHDTTQIRADNGRCLSGGYTVPDSSQIAEVEEVEEEEEAESTEVAVGPDGVVILPDDWGELSPIEKLLLNPWGCHDTTQIRADNGRCLSGGYTIPDSSQIAEVEEVEEEEEAESTEVAVGPDGVVILPDDWGELSPIEKLLLNPWGCHDTTQIRADNGRCLSGGYTVPDSSQIAEVEEVEEEEEAESTEVAVGPDGVVILPDDWGELSPIEKLLLNPWGCRDTTQIRADNGRCLSGGYTIPNSNQV